jgi:hypothetical protein
LRGTGVFVVGAVLSDQLLLDRAFESHRDRGKRHRIHSAVPPAGKTRHGSTGLIVGVKKFHASI